MSVKTLNYQVKFLASNDSALSYKEAVCKFFNDLKYDKFEKHFDFGEVKIVHDEFDYDELLEISVRITCSGLKNDHDFQNFATYIHKMWSKLALEDVFLNWLIPNNSYINSPTYITIGSLRPIEIAFGTLPGLKDYVQTYRFRQFQPHSSILFNLNHLQKEIVIYMSCDHKPECSLSGDTGFKISFPYDSIIRILANTGSDVDAAEMFLQLEYPPFIYREIPGLNENNNDEILRIKVTKVKEMEYSSKHFERTFEIGCSCNWTYCRSEIIGRNLVLKLIIEDKFQFRWNLEQLSLRCANRTEICFTNIKTHHLKDLNKVKLKYFPHYIYGKNKLREVDKFNCDYAWSVIHSRSDSMLHQMSLKNMEKVSFIKELLKVILSLTKSNISAFVKSLYFIADMIDKGVGFDFLQVMKKKFLYFCNFVELNELPKGMVYVRRVIITPSRTLFLQPYEHFDNRIVRKFGIEFMLRVSIQDDNFTKLTFAVQYNSRKEEIMHRIVGDVLLKGIRIGCRNYEALAASTSQLREHGMWLYAQDNHSNTASSIRQWMGDFSKIKNVAKCMARMGQCLSSTETGVQILINEEDEVELKEIIKGKYIFSDGIGVISPKLAEDVRLTLFQNSHSSTDISIDKRNIYDPIAYQIRYKGCKGMVVEFKNHKELDLSGCKLGIRPSMKKFECPNSNNLEIVKTSAPTQLFLNKHLITILEQMGVPKEVFMNLELNMILHLLDSVIDEKVAANLLTHNLSPVFPFHTLQKAGFALTRDPFFRSLLLAYFKSFAEKLKINMRIAIPDQYGRNMLGVLDETKTLKYGEVFVQYSKSLTDPKAGLRILKGSVLVTKNPSLHPGDVRKLTAVDVPALHHIKDCIVFPAKGSRPHPDEMAGSDLDGDEMVVIWYKSLIFPRKSAKPMDYPVYKEECNNKTIELPDMIKFFCEYIQNDNIGTFAHAHLVWADKLEDGIFSKKCMAIARRYPYVLDFAKHGTTEYLKKSERPHHYPDFLQKGLRGNTYHSHKVLGSLYRTSRVLDACSSKISLMCETLSYDPDLEYPGWKMYEDSAEMHRKEYVAKVLEVLDRYSLSSEAEAFSGFIELEPYKRWRQEKANAIKVVKTYLCSIMGYYKNLFLTELRQESKEKKLSNEEKLEKKYQRASAWYMVIYGKNSTRVLSFPWVLSDILSDIKIKNTRNNNSSGSVPSSFFDDIDSDIKRWCSLMAISCDERNCLCNYLLRKITSSWISSSGLNIGNSDDSIYCSECFDRIFNFYKSKSVMQCCSKFSTSPCICSESCSTSKLLIDFLNFYISNEEVTLGKCNKDSCNGFLPKNLQELALQTYSYVGITRNISYLGINFDSDNFTKNAIPSNISEIFEEEGDPIKIPADPSLKTLIGDYNDDIKAFLKKKSGVRDITLTPDHNSGCLIVNSIGKNWQRWNLQEILLDSNFVDKLKDHLIPSFTNL